MYTLSGDFTINDTYNVTDRLFAVFSALFNT